MDFTFNFVTRMVQGSYMRVRLPSHHFPLNFMKDRNIQQNLKILSMNISWQKFWNTIRLFSESVRYYLWLVKSFIYFIFKMPIDIAMLFFVNRQEITHSGLVWMTNKILVNCKRPPQHKSLFPRSCTLARKELLCPLNWGAQVSLKISCSNE